MALKENLDSILTIKNNIKNSLISLGISLTGKKFSDYSTIISSLDLEKHNVTTASKTITNNGTTTIQPTNTNDVYNKVTVTTNVQPALQTKNVTPTTSTQNVVPDSGYYGLSSVNVSAIKTQSKSCTPSTTSQTISPDSGCYLSSVSVGAIQTQTKSVNPTTTSQTVNPDSGKYLSGVSVGAIQTEEKTQTITSNGTTTITPSSGKYISKVTTTVNVKPALQTKSVTPTTSTQNVVPDSSYDGLSKVTVNPIQTQTKSVTPTTTTQNVLPDSGKYLSGVSVGAIQTETKSSNVTSNGSVTLTPSSGKYLSSVAVNINVPDYPNSRSSLYKKGICSVTNNDTTMNSEINNLPSVSILKDITINNISCYTLNENKDTSYILFTDLMNLGGDISSIFINNVENKPIFAMSLGSKWNSAFSSYYIEEISSRNTLWLINAHKTFYNMRNLKSIPIIDLTDCYALQYMFYNCKNLKQINLKGRANRNSSYYEAGMNAAYNAGYMFAGCTNLEEIHGLDITNIFTTTNMWEGCTNLKHLTFSGTETIKGEVYLATYSRVMTNHDLYEALHSLPTPKTTTNLYVNKYTMTDANGNYINGWNVKKVARFESDAAYYNWTVKYVYN